MPPSAITGHYYDSNGWFCGRHPMGEGETGSVGPFPRGAKFWSPLLRNA